MLDRKQHLGNGRFSAGAKTSDATPQEEHSNSAQVKRIQDSRVTGQTARRTVNDRISCVCSRDVHEHGTSMCSSIKAARAPKTVQWEIAVAE